MRDPVASELFRRFCSCPWVSAVLRYNQRGVDGSEGRRQVRGGADLEDAPLVADALAAAIRGLPGVARSGAEPRIAVVGYSWGCCVAAAAARSKSVAAYVGVSFPLGGVSAAVLSTRQRFDELAARSRLPRLLILGTADGFSPADLAATMVVKAGGVLLRSDDDSMLPDEEATALYASSSDDEDDGSLAFCQPQSAEDAGPRLASGVFCRPNADNDGWENVERAEGEREGHKACSKATASAEDRAGVASSAPACAEGSSPAPSETPRRVVDADGPLGSCSAEPTPRVTQGLEDEAKHERKEQGKEREKGREKELGAAEGEASGAGAPHVTTATAADAAAPGVAPSSSAASSLAPPPLAVPSSPPPAAAAAAAASLLPSPLSPAAAASPGSLASPSPRSSFASKVSQKLKKASGSLSRSFSRSGSFSKLADAARGAEGATAGPEGRPSSRTPSATASPFKRVPSFGSFGRGKRPGAGKGGEETAETAKDGSVASISSAPAGGPAAAPAPSAPSAPSSSASVAAPSAPPSSSSSAAPSAPPSSSPAAAPPSSATPLSARWRSVWNAAASAAHSAASAAQSAAEAAAAAATQAARGASACGDFAAYEQEAPLALRFFPNVDHFWMDDACHMAQNAADWVRDQLEGQDARDWSRRGAPLLRPSGPVTPRETTPPPEVAGPLEEHAAKGARIQCSDGA